MPAEKILKAPIPGLFFKFTIPAILSMLLIGVQSIIDGLFLGRVCGSLELAAVNLAQPFMQTIFGLTLLLSIGGLSLAGRQLGAADHTSAQTTLQTVFRAITGVMLMILLIGACFSTPLAQLLGANEQLQSHTATYIRILSLFAPLTGLMVHLGFLQRLINRPERYLISAIVSLVVNILLDYLFIVHLGWGITGAALGTGLAYTASFLVVAPVFFKPQTVWSFRQGAFNWRILPTIMANGSSEAVASASAAITVFLFNLIFMHFLGTDGVAAFTVINYLSQIALLLMFGVADGISPLVSYNSGHGSHHRVKSVMKMGLHANLLIGLALFFPLFLGSRELTGLFIPNQPELLELTAKGAKLYAFAFLFSGFSLLYSSYFTAIGAALYSALVAFGRGLLFIIPGLILLPQLFGTNGIWLAIPVAEIATVVLTLFLLKRHRAKSI